MADCSKTEEFFKELKRMCNKYRCTKYNASCSRCEIYQHCYDFSCYSFVKNNPLKAVEIVQKWSDENPTKTRQGELLKMFPDVKLLNGVVGICPRDIDKKIECCAPQTSCFVCEKEFWLSEVE